MEKSKINKKNFKKNMEDEPSLLLEENIFSSRGSLFSRFFLKRNRSDWSLRDHLKAALNDPSIDEKIFSKQERVMLHNVFLLRDQRTDDIMIPRAEIKAMEMLTTLGEALQEFEKSGHSRMPIYEQTLDNPKGMVHIRDILNYITKKSHPKPLDKLDLSYIPLDKTLLELKLIRSVLFVPNSMPAAQLLTRMQSSHIQMALVIDEHGGTDGLVSLEDIVELIVGDIEDEHDDADNYIIQETENSWLVDARAYLEDLQDTIGSDLVVADKSDDVDTLCGLIVSLIERIPEPGEVIRGISNYKFKILKADTRRIQLVRIFREK